MFLSDIFKLLSLKERWQAFGIIGLTIGCSLLEMLAVMAVVPFVEVLTRGEVSYPIVRSLLMSFGASHFSETLIAVSSILLLTYIVKVIANILLLHTQNRFAFSKQDELGRAIFRSYLTKPYGFFHDINTAEIQKNVVNVVVWAIQNALLPTMYLISEAITFLMIMCLLCVTDFVSTLVVGAIFTIILGGLAKYYKKRIDRAGTLQNQSVNNEIFWISQTFGSIKEVEVMQRKEYFYGRFSRASEEYAAASADNYFISQLPRSVIEMTAIIALNAVVLITIFYKGYSPGVLSTLGLFSVAAFRIMPSMNRISYFVSSIRFYSHGIKTIIGHYDPNGKQQREAHNNNDIEFQKNICFDNVSFSYDNSDTEALRSVSLLIKKGQSVGIIGPSGSGKTTLIDLLLGLYPVESGSVTIDGCSLSQCLSSWRSQVGYIPQNIHLLDGSIMENVAFGIPECEIDASKVTKALEIAQLKDFVEQQQEGLNTRVGESGVRLSGGQRQRIGIARAMYHNPQVIIMDEATSALDTDTEAAFTEAINQLIGQKTLIIIAHRLSTIEKCDRIVRVVDGTIEEIIERVK